MKFSRIITTACLVATLASCAGMKLATISTPLVPDLAAQVKDASLTLAPVDLQLSSSRAEFDLRDVTITIDGQTFALQGRFLETTDDMKLGKVGVLDTNIFKKAKIDVSALAAYAAERFAAGLSASGDVRFPINAEMPDAGDYSSRPLTYDFSKYPWVASFTPDTAPLAPIFKTVALGSSGAEYVLSLRLTLRSEIFEILTTDAYIQNKFLSAGHQPAQGDYYLSYLAYAEFSLTEARTGKVIMTEKTPQTNPAIYVVSDTVYLPIANKDSGAYAKYFRTYDFSAAAKSIVTELADGLLLSFKPFYRNINQYVKVEEKQ